MINVVDTRAIITVRTRLSQNTSGAWDRHRQASESCRLSHLAVMRPVGFFVRGEGGPELVPPIPFDYVSDSVHVASLSHERGNRRWVPAICPLVYNTLATRVHSIWSPPCPDTFLPYLVLSLSSHISTIPCHIAVLSFIFSALLLFVL